MTPEQMDDRRREAGSPSEKIASSLMFHALNRLAKWRVLFTGWQLGTRTKGDPESDAISDHREVTIFVRAEVSALVGLLIAKGAFTAEEWTLAIAREADLLNADYERRFPGVTADGMGLTFTSEAQEWMKDWRP